VLLCILDTEGAKTMPLCAVGEEKDAACEGISTAGHAAREREGSGFQDASSPRIPHETMPISK
jgi:hypothetical protein